MFKALLQKAELQKASRALEGTDERFLGKGQFTPLWKGGPKEGRTHRTTS